VDTRLAVDDIELELGGSGTDYDALAADLPTEPDGCAVGLLSRIAKIGRAPVVDEILSDAAGCDREEGRGGDAERGDGKDAGAAPREVSVIGESFIMTLPVVASC